MMALVSAGLNAMLSGLTSVASHVSLHTADPGTDGSNEVTGGTYSRELADWDAPDAGTVTNDGAIVFDVPSSTTITHVGYWSAGTAGTFYGSRPLDTEQTYATAGTYTIAAGNLSESVS
jgi:hypothetical protein